MTSKPEFSRPISIEGITPDKIRTETIEATAEECAALSRRFDLRSLSDLKAKISIRRVAGGGATVRVEGAFGADVVQACVVSLRDVPGRLDGRFDTYFTEDRQETGAEIDIPFDDDAAVPEVVNGGMIDLGEIVAQYLSLELEPYPRAPGVSLAAQMAETGLEVKNSPFQILEALKDRKKGEAE